MDKTNLIDLLIDRFQKYKDLTGMRVDDRSFTYGEIYNYSINLAKLLKKIEVNSEAVGVVGQRSAASYFSILGIIFAGCHYVPINLKYDDQKKSKIIRDSKIRVLVGSPEDLESINSSIDLANLNNIDYLITPYGKFEDKSSHWLDERDCNLMNKSNLNGKNESTLAYVMYTSGSTGNPKGVMVTKANLLSWIENMNDLYPKGIGFIASQTYDLSFDLSVADIFFTFINGGVLSVLSEKEQLMPFDYINNEKIEFWSSVPTLVSFMHKMNFLKPNSFPSIKTSLFCGEPLPKSLADAWMIAAPNSTIENLYGPTEATIWLTRYIYEPGHKGETFTNNNLPIGKPFKKHNIELIDKNENIVMDGSSGEIIYKGPQITLGYLNDKTKTDSVFKTFFWDKSKSIWYKSGDIGKYNNVGYLECLGRTDSQIKIAGRRIELGELEASLRSIKDLDDIVIVAVKDSENRVKNLIGYTMNNIDEKDILKFRKDSSKNIESIFFPKHIIHIDKFPITPSGKTDRKKLESLANEL